MADYAIGIDLGGTKIAAALVDPDGAVAARIRKPTLAEEGVGPVVERITSCIRQLLNQADGNVLGLAVGAPAMTDSQHGVIILASNLKWANVPLRDFMQERLGPTWMDRIWVDKDTNAAVLGEMLYGAGKGANHLLYVTVGTGVGGGMVLDGRLYHGANEGAADIGHLVLDPQGIACGCGKRGCLETIASGTAIARLAREALDQGIPSTLTGLKPMELTAVEVVEAAKEGDELAWDILVDAGRNLGIALAYYADINNPERIIVGGGVAAAGNSQS